uniref:Uncharacterized protein n=1 Tax=Rhizophora mucronata TaxID=61149 RepID=A0A2P2JJ58_RHIMU
MQSNETATRSCQEIKNEMKTGRQRRSSAGTQWKRQKEKQEASRKR